MKMPLDELASALQCTLFPVQVLVVDDDADARGAMQRVLERQGYSVVVASSGTQALELLQGTHVPVDLLISDVQMPGISGDALVAQVRQSWPDLPVLFVSGESNYSALPEEAGGRSQFLLKPFGQEELLVAVLRLLAPFSESPEGNGAAQDVPAPAISHTPALL